MSELEELEAELNYLKKINSEMERNFELSQRLKKQNSDRGSKLNLTPNSREGADLFGDKHSMTLAESKRKDMELREDIADMMHNRNFDCFDGHLSYEEIIQSMARGGYKNKQKPSRSNRLTDARGYLFE